MSTTVESDLCPLRNYHRSLRSTECKMTLYGYCEPCSDFMRKCVREYINDIGEHPMYDPNKFVTWAASKGWSLERKRRFDAFVRTFRLEEPDMVSFRMSRTRLRLFAGRNETDVVKDSKIAVLQIMQRMTDTDKLDVMKRLSSDNPAFIGSHISNLERYISALEYSLQTQKSNAAKELESVRCQLNATIAALVTRVAQLESEISLQCSMPSTEEIEGFFYTV